MEKCLNKTQKTMKSLVFALLFMGVVIGVANAAPPLPTSYYGYVRIAENGSLMPNTSITVLAAGTVIASATSNSDGTYLIIVPWDDPATTQDEGVVSGETITFTVSGKTVTSRVIDAQGTNNKLDLNVPTTTTTPTSGGPSVGGGGGGGVVSGESFANIATTESYDKDLVANTPVTYTFKASAGVYEITVTDTNSESRITLKVESLKATSSQVTVQPPGIVHTNMNIQIGTQRLQGALIKFKVENSWLSNNGFAGSDVKMLHWVGSQWTQLETTQTTKDDTYTYYEAKTNSFSPFAISGLKGGVIVPTATPMTTGTLAMRTGTGTPSPTPTMKAQSFEFVLTIAMLSAAYLLGIKRR